jgi:hypothetical protein
MMWNYFAAVTRLRVWPRLSLSPGTADPDVLAAAFPGLRCVWLRRTDELRQTISFGRAATTEQYALADGERPPPRLCSTAAPSADSPGTPRPVPPPAAPPGRPAHRSLRRTLPPARPPARRPRCHAARPAHQAATRHGKGGSCGSRSSPPECAGPRDAAAGRKAGIRSDGGPPAPICRGLVSSNFRTILPSRNACGQLKKIAREPRIDCIKYRSRIVTGSDTAIAPCRLFA